MHERLFSRADLRGKDEALRFSCNGVSVQIALRGSVICAEIHTGGFFQLVELKPKEWDAVIKAYRRFCDAYGL